jgi:hypothetical protein
MKNRWFVIAILLIFLWIVSSCNGIFPTPFNLLSTPNIEQTVEIQVAKTLAAAVPSALQAFEGPGIDAALEMLPDTSTPEPKRIEITLTPILTSEPTQTGTPTFTFTPSTTPTSIPLAKTQELQARIKTANILIFEDASEANLIPRLDDVMGVMGISGGVVVNAHQEPGRFLNYLNDGTIWDLIIIANESRAQPNTWLIYESMPFIEKHNTALIVETWNLDEDSNKGASYLMDRCGIRVEKSWYRPEDYQVEDFLIYNFPQEDPILSYPNQILIPIRPSVYWMGDVGDLMRLLPGSKSRFIAGLYSNDPANYGLITSCGEGRILIQTFSTHDYRIWETKTLWENYITFTLSNHFNAPK